MALLLAGLPESIPGSPSTGCADRASMPWHRCARHSLRRGGVADRRRCRKHEPGPFVMRQGRDRFPPRRQAGRHHHRLAIRQPGDEGQVYGVDSMPRDSGKRGRRILASPARIRSRSRCAASSAPRRAQSDGLFAEEIVPVTMPRKKSDPVIVDVDEHPRPDTTLEALAKLGAGGPARRHSHRGQCLGRQRRRGCPVARLASRGASGMA